MTIQNDPDSRVTSARRRLLRGSLSVPTVLTLSSGAALANGSTIRCFNNATGLVDPGAISVRGLQRYKKVISGTTYYYVKRAELDSRAAADGFSTNTSFVTTSNSAAYIKVHNGQGHDGTGVEVDTGKFVGMRFNYISTNPTGQRFAITGLFVGSGTGQYSGSGNVMYASCWTSCAGIK